MPGNLNIPIKWIHLWRITLFLLYWRYTVFFLRPSMTYMYFTTCSIHIYLTTFFISWSTLRCFGFRPHWQGDLLFTLFYNTDISGRCCSFVYLTLDNIKREELSRLLFDKTRHSCTSSNCPWTSKLELNFIIQWLGSKKESIHLTNQPFVKFAHDCLICYGMIFYEYKQQFNIYWMSVSRSFGILPDAQASLNPVH